MRCMGEMKRLNTLLFRHLGQITRGGGREKGVSRGKVGVGVCLNEATRETIPKIPQVRLDPPPTPSAAAMVALWWIPTVCFPFIVAKIPALFSKAFGP
jgi:hypothetical protein